MVKYFKKGISNITIFAEKIEDCVKKIANLY